GVVLAEKVFDSVFQQAGEFSATFFFVLVGPGRVGINNPAQNGGAGHLPSVFFSAILWRVGRNVCRVGKNVGNEKKVQCPGHLFTLSSGPRITHGMNWFPSARYHGPLSQEMKKHGRPGLRLTTPSPFRDAWGASISTKRFGHAEASTGMPTARPASERTNAISD